MSVANAPASGVDPVTTTAALSLASLPAWLLLLALGGWLSSIDAREHRLPNRILLPGTLAAIVLIAGASVVNTDAGGLARALAGGVVTFTALLLLALPRATGMGMGDVKLGMLTGMYCGWLGWTWVLLGLCVAFLLAGGWAGFLLASRRARRSTPIAFGPFMVAGVVACLTGAVFVGGPMGMLTTGELSRMGGLSG